MNLHHILADTSPLQVVAVKYDITYGMERTFPFYMEVSRPPLPRMRDKEFALRLELNVDHLVEENRACAFLKDSVHDAKGTASCGRIHASYDYHNFAAAGCASQQSLSMPALRGCHITEISEPQVKHPRGPRDEAAALVLEQLKLGTHQSAKEEDTPKPDGLLHLQA